MSVDARPANLGERGVRSTFQHMSTLFEMHLGGGGTTPRIFTIAHSKSVGDKKEKLKRKESKHPIHQPILPLLAHPTAQRGGVQEKSNYPIVNGHVTKAGTPSRKASNTVLDLPFHKRLQTPSVTVLPCPPGHSSNLLAPSHRSSDSQNRRRRLPLGGGGLMAASCSRFVAVAGVTYPKYLVGKGV